MKRYCWNCLIALDQFINVLAGPLLNLALKPVSRFGDPDETLSSVFGKNVRAGHCRTCRWLCRLLNRADPNHCHQSIEPDEGDKAL
ncbi:MAG: hypothetical protein HYV16_16460 [Gammaproteobacteria bacterium]|nr:hypothetical protein [Gammaproteobacteria bacterium]